jgi:hypothetical protein
MQSALATGGFAFRGFDYSLARTYVAQYSTVQYTSSRSSFIICTVRLCLVFLLFHSMVFVFFSILLCNLTKKVLKNLTGYRCWQGRVSMQYLYSCGRLNYSRCLAIRGVQGTWPRGYQGSTLLSFCSVMFFLFFQQDCFRCFLCYMSYRYIMRVWK